MGTPLLGINKTPKPTPAPSLKLPKWFPDRLTSLRPGALQPTPSGGLKPSPPQTPLYSQHPRNSPRPALPLPQLRPLPPPATLAAGSSGLLGFLQDRCFRMLVSSTPNDATHTHTHTHTHHTHHTHTEQPFTQTRENESAGSAPVLRVQAAGTGQCLGHRGAARGRPRGGSQARRGTTNPKPRPGIALHPHHGPGPALLHGGAQVPLPLTCQGPPGRRPSSARTPAHRARAGSAVPPAPQGASPERRAPGRGGDELLQKEGD